ncbi:MAG TPA: hypothetical protein VGU45_11960 [Microvirga sp.]|jgi:transcriptional antiterminator|nr:hypothetical protein [Microvirga sp.]
MNALNNLPPAFEKKRVIRFKAIADVLGISERSLRRKLDNGTLALPLVDLGTRCKGATLGDVEALVESLKQQAA